MTGRLATSATSTLGGGRGRHGRGTAGMGIEDGGSAAEARQPGQGRRR